MTLFGTDGIRGRAGEPPLDDRTVFAVGLALADHIAKDRHGGALIGMDTRESGPGIVRLLAAGLKDGGVAPEFAGVLPTPAVAHATRNGSYGLGVVVSASHNPFRDNGIKVFGPSGYKLPDDCEAAVEGRVHALLSNGIRPRLEEPTERPDVAQAYIRHLLEAVPVSERARRLRFVVDCANGAAVRIAPRLMELSGCQASFTACEPTGKNINLGCGALHMRSLGRRVVDSGADFGFAMDGDSDRCLLVDEQGDVLDGDHLLLLAASALKRRRRLQGDLVVATVMSNLALDVALQGLGIRLVRTPVGDRHVTEGMLAAGASLGGEQSGHLVFSDHSTTGDGLLAMLFMLRILAEEGVPCSSLRKRMKPFPQRLVNVRVREKRPLDTLPEIKSEIADREMELAGRGRVLIRYSGTEPVVRVMVEAERRSDVVLHSTQLAELFEKHLGE
ncbi:MAG: phosphoglucosamine mutase [Bryobacterales bacterium]|nr:phosphoglucosamine mutase [Bryobacterales bacterium]